MAHEKSDTRSDESMPNPGSQPVLKRFRKKRPTTSVDTVEVLDFTLTEGASEAPGYDPYNRPPPPIEND